MGKSDIKSFHAIAIRETICLKVRLKKNLIVTVVRKTLPREILRELKMGKKQKKDAYNVKKHVQKIK